MSDLKIAVFPTALSTDPHEGMRMAAAAGVPGVHLSLQGEWAPDQLDAAACARLLAEVRSLGMVVSAVSWGVGELPHREEHEAMLASGRRCLEIAAELECGLWQAHCGVVPWETTDPGWAATVDAAGALAAHGEQVGATLCVETGPEPPWVLQRLLEEVNSPALGVNYDPANLIIWPVILCEMAKRPYEQSWSDENFNPQAGAERLLPWIRHTHAKDALVQDDGQYLEVPLGEGWVDWPRYVATLQAGGFDGFFAIEREVGPDRAGDTLRAVDFLRGL
ncbi:MAG TPA: sugar phosphate isomerase/epimerase family protein [Armatimonadota bacterium]|jgi:sugar phosphate isomerase/epimerase